MKRLIRDLKKKNFLCSAVGIKIKYKDFTSITRSKQLSFPMDNKNDLFETTAALMEKIQIKGGIRLVGISFSHLVKKDTFKTQLSFKF